MEQLDTFDGISVTVAILDVTKMPKLKLQSL